MDFPRLTQLEDYEPFIGAEAVARLHQKARALQHLHVVHVNSTYYGGGVAETLSSLTLLMNTLASDSGRSGLFQHYQKDAQCPARGGNQPH